MFWVIFIIYFLGAFIRIENYLKWDSEIYFTIYTTFDMKSMSMQLHNYKVNVKLFYKNV